MHPESDSTHALGMACIISGLSALVIVAMLWVM